MVKTIFMGLVVCVFGAAPLFSQTLCEGFLPFEQGISFEQTYYDVRGKVSSISVSYVEGILPAEKGSKALILQRLIDEKGKEIDRGQYEIFCREGNFYLHVNDLLNPGMLDAYQSMDMAFSGEGLQFPAELSIGQELPKGVTILEVASNGVPVITLTYTVKDRKVEDLEQITTPSGTFDCFRIRETIDYQTMLLTRTFTTVSWYARGVGMVKQETYDQKGKLSGWMELTKTGR